VDDIMMMYQSMNDFLLNGKEKLSFTQILFGEKKYIGNGLAKTNGMSKQIYACIIALFRK